MIESKASMCKKNFSINDTVVYSGQGVGIVKEIIQKTISGETIDYYVIYLADSDMTVLVPFEKTSSLGVRPVITKEDALAALQFLAEVNEPVIMDWKARYQKNMQLFKSGDIKNTAIVVKSLYRRSKVKELPIQERKLYEAAYSIFQDEIIAVLNLTKKEVEVMIHKSIEPENDVESQEDIISESIEEYDEYDEDDLD